MNDHDEPLLRHVREHSREQPGPALDARILAAAADAAASKRRQPEGFWARLRRTLGDASASRRWSAALGCLAVVGVGLGLSLQTLEQAPGRYDAPPASMQRQAPMALQAPASPAPMAEMSEAPRVMARLAAEAAPPSADVLAALRKIAGLRERGETEQARQRLEQLQAEHPGLDVEAELRRLPER
ncbi:hypothetical protein [Pseudomonas sp. PA27(2017)]|uniref:hypothetical protein n=1 Tax=Pseudomonas sp. PA27(2017) TaxID=1932112 RepID=UPI0009685497|nr:hypothetical protein [Pseudomonas sp. PA27(2017)]OLU29113.1 hypothetical protein BVH06_16625 [Pseudomonas sp. PA27(2017)]